MDALREAAEAGMRAMAEKLQPVTEAAIAVVTSFSGDPQQRADAADIAAVCRSRETVEVSGPVMAELIERVAEFAPGPGPGWWQTQ
jgi:hypothetical protein